jgi:MFS family permease
VGLVQFLPMLGFSLPAGQAADRYDRRAIILLCQVLLVLTSGALFWLSHVGYLETFLIYSLLVLVGTTRSFFGPSSSAFLPHLVTEEELPKAVALNSSIWQMSVIVGPTLGGFIYAFSSKADAVYLASAITMGLAFSLVLVIRTRTGRMDKAPLTRQTLLAGIRYVWEQKILLGAMSLDLFAVLLGGAVALLPIYASDILKVGPSGLGLLRSAPSLGAAITGLFLTVRPIQSHVGLRLFVCVGLFGLFTIVFGVSTSFWLSLVCLCCMGALDLVSVVTRQSLIQIRTPSKMRGRVSAVSLVFISASNELGEFESGITAAWFGVVPAVIIGGAGTLLVTVVWAYLFPPLRKLNQFTST